MLWCLIGLVLLPANLLAEVNFDSGNTRERIAIRANEATRWQEGEGQSAGEVWLLKGNCSVVQGQTVLRGDEAVVWVERQGDFGNPTYTATVYVEGQVTIAQGGSAPPVGNVQPSAFVGARRDAPPWYGRLYSDQSPDFTAGQTAKGEPNSKPAIYERARTRRSPPIGIERTQYIESPAESVPPPQFAAPAPGTRRVVLEPRLGGGTSLATLKNPQNPQEMVYLVTGGVRIRIDGLGQAVSGVRVGDVLDIEADRVVIWSPADVSKYFNGQSDEPETVPLELYLEGDIVFREGQRVVYAQSMYYNVPQRTGTILNAEVVTPVRNNAGALRLRTNVLRQVGQDQFVAEGASVTTSRLALPSYEFRSGSLALVDSQVPEVNPLTGTPVIDPATGEQRIRHLQNVTSTNNVVFVDGIPVFYWPILSTDLREPTLYIQKLAVKNDSIFGTSIETQWDLYQLLGWQTPPEGTDWNLSLDYLTERGPAAGTKFTYDRDFLFGTPQPTLGFADAWFIDDGGLDTLGLGRMGLVPEEEIRGRVLARHRQELPNFWQLTAELGYISDRNFLEQYFEREWDEQPDARTGVELKRTVENTSLALALDVRINDFFQETEHLPNLDHYVIGHSLWMDRLTWYEHTSLGYLRQNPASTPVDPRDAATFAPLPYEAPVEGERVATRQALEFPIDTGPMKIVPFVLGEAAHWGETLDQDDTQRVYGQAGVRTSLPIWAVDPAVENHLFNLHGLAHKISLEGEFSVTDASEDLGVFPLYDEIDDNSVQHFRRRLAFQTFGGPAPVPPEFDERFYAVRRGLMDSVTGPTEIAEDLKVFRFGLRQRWQTKRGPPDNRRIIDWVTLNTHAEVFPDEDENFGENIGLLDYDLRWHVGDRLTLLSEGAADFFSQGGKLFSVGASLNRPPRGNLFFGFRSLEGPISSNVLLASYSYRMSPKWASSFGITYDMSNNGAMGQSFTLTRIGESFLFSLGFNADRGRDNVGIAVALEPRFLPRTSFGRRTGIIVPPAGAFGIE
jgi:hypothetical protein